MVYRIYVEKKNEPANEAVSLLSDAKSLLGIKTLENVRVINRYDAENISPELFSYAVKTVFSEPQTDTAVKEINIGNGQVFAVEYLPGQFDQRADSAEQCIQIISRQNRPTVRTAKVYALYGKLSEKDVAAIKKYVINPVEAREASLEKPKTLKINYTFPAKVETLKGFTKLNRKELGEFTEKYSLAMDLDDIEFCQKYFISEKREPTITEIKVIDAYWSDHCRHTTFLTVIDTVRFEDEMLRSAFNDYMRVRKESGSKRPICLMDIATVATKYFKKLGKLKKLDESDEINACTVKIEIEVNGEKEPWLLLFKNETHNHPTEIEPFGGAATCIGGAIRDPLSGRSYVYGAMRLTGAANPLKSAAETLKGKLPQKKIVTSAAAGYSSYGNQIGLATGIVDEIYHEGYAAKRMEIGAVIAAAPEKNVQRKRPLPGDRIILLGGATGRDGCGGATGSSKPHTEKSLESCGAEVQKGNAPEERKLQRLFRNREVCAMIKRCNDFGAGGVAVAVGEIADGLEINLNAIPKKYEGLDGTELAISESQERMAVVIAAEDVETFLTLAAKENLRARPIAVVTEIPRLVMEWNGEKIVDISRKFLNSNGAEKHIDADIAKGTIYKKEIKGRFAENFISLAGDLNICSKRGLAERFDSTIGAGTVLMPFGGKNQLTPIQAMVQKISVEKKHTDDCSVMAWGYNPFITEKSPYRGAYLAVIESVCKLIATGAKFTNVYLTFQEYFERLGKDPKRWGKPLAALLGSFEAQLKLNIAAIGGKDSMSGSFEKLDVPPTLVSFAVTTEKAFNIVSPEFKKPENFLVKLTPKLDDNGLPETASLLEIFNKVNFLLSSGKAVSCYTPGMGGIAEAVMKMCFGNSLGFSFENGISLEEIFSLSYGSFLLETSDAGTGKIIGKITDDGKISYKNESISLKELLRIYEAKLESVYPVCADKRDIPVENFTYAAETRYLPSIKTAKPKVLIPAFPGTNCEYDSAKAMRDAGVQPEIIVIRNLSSADISESIEYFAKQLESAQIIFIPGGFSGGDEPDGSGKFITAFFRSARLKEGVTELIEKRDGLICGICNGFQALIKLGLLPFGKIMDIDENCPTLTYNAIGRHQSKIVKTRIASNKSPWLALTKPGEIYSVPISHGEGRFTGDEKLIKRLAENGQIATQYADNDGNASTDIRFNPNGSIYAVEGITSPDGRIFGKMGHSERLGSCLYKNVPGNYDIKMFDAAARYFR